MPDNRQDDVTDTKVTEEMAQDLLADAVRELEDSDADTPKTYDEKYVRKLRDEAASRRVRENELASQLADMQAKVKQFEDAQLSDQERATKELEELRSSSASNKARAQELEVNYQLAIAAADPANGIGDVKAAIKLLDRDSLEFDAKGRVTNLQDALETLKTEYPSLGLVARPTAPNPGTTNPAKSKAATKWTRDDLQKMTPEKIVELQESGELNHLLRGR